MTDTKVNQANNQYNNKFDVNNKYSSVLFNPDRPLFQSDLNEIQSMVNAKLEILGNSWFKDGAVLSGMKITTEANNSADTTSTPNQSKNLLSLSNVSSNNSTIDTAQWHKNGQVSISPFITVGNSYPGFEIDDSAISASTNTITLSFAIKQTNGTLRNIYGSYINGITVSQYSIDGQNIATSLNSQQASGIVTSSGNQINLADGNLHNVIITFTNVASSEFKFLFGANVGFNMMSPENSVSYTVSNMEINAGTSVQPWELSDEDTSGTGSNVRNTSLKVASGFVFLDGEPRVFSPQSIAITGHGKETIGLILTEDVVTPEQDPRLRDSTTGSMSYWDISSDRLHYDVTLSYNDPTATVLVNLQDGVVANDANGSIDQMAKLNDILARRTNDEAGSFLVEGMELFTQANQTDSSKINVLVNPGVAYVLGYGLYPTVPKMISIDKSVIPGSDLSEPLIYNSADSSWGILANQPVQSITNLSGYIVNPGVTMNRGNGASDNLPDNNTYAISQVYSGPDSNRTVYTPYSPTGPASTVFDYHFDKGNNKIIWNINSDGINTNATAHPIPGTNTSYYIDEEQTHNYRLSEFSLVDTKTGEVAYKTATDLNSTNVQNIPVLAIQFLDNAPKPVEGSVVTINYTYFLARADIITIDKNGDLHSIEGQPAPLQQVQPPTRVDPNTLQLGYVTLYPNSTRAVCQNASIQRLTQQSLQDVVSRVQNNEQSIQALQLAKQASVNQDPTTMQGSFVDNFTSAVYGDYTNRDFNVSFDFARNAITLPTLASKDFTDGNPNGKLRIDKGASRNIHTYPGNVITPEYAERPIVSQLLATTDTININPQGTLHFINLGNISIDPNTDTWTDTSTNLQYVKGTTTNVDVSAWWAHNNTSVAPGMLNGYTGDQVIQQYPLDPGYSWGWGSYGKTVKSTKNTMQSATSTTEIETFARPRQIQVTGKGYLANADNLTLTIDGVSLPIYANNSSYSGTLPDTVKADADGNVNAHFAIPANTIKTGVREVVLKNSNNKANTIYQSTGLSVKNNEVILQNETDLHIIDPVAQSINITEDMGTGLLTSVGLYFKSKDTTEDNANNEITVQLRKMGDQGYPTNIVLNGKGTHLKNSQVLTSNDASLETRVPFDTPVPFKVGDSFAITIISQSNSFELFRNTYGMPMIGGTSEDNTTDGYPQGMLFESTNSQTWVANEHDDLKFNLYQGIFNTNAILEFQTIYLDPDSPNSNTTDPYYFTTDLKDGTQKPITDDNNNKIRVNVSDFAMLLASLTYSNTGMNWQIKILAGDALSSTTINSVDWIAVQNGDVVDPNVTKAVQGAKAIKLRAQFKTDSRDSTGANCAITSLNGITLGAVLTGVRGAYISRNVDESAAPFNALQTNFVAYIPEGTEVDAYYSIDTGTSWYHYPNQGLQVTDLGNDLKQYSYRVRFADQSKGNLTTHKNFKIRLELYSNNVFKKPYISKLANSMSVQTGDETGNTTYSLVADYVDQKGDPIGPNQLPIMTSQKNFNMIDKNGSAQGNAPLRYDNNNSIQ